MADEPARDRLDSQVRHCRPRIDPGVERGLLVLALVGTEQDQGRCGAAEGISPVEQVGQRGKDLIAAHSDNEAHRLASAPGGSPPCRLEQCGQFLIAEHRVGIESPRTPPVGDRRVDRTSGLGATVCGLVRHRRQVTRRSGQAKPAPPTVYPYGRPIRSNDPMPGKG